MKTILFAAVALTIPAAQAANFGHPDAASIAIMGAAVAEVCHYNRDYPTPNWLCYNRTLNGARNPLVIALPKPGPVVVRNATWAFAAEECIGEQLALAGVVDPPLLPPKLNSEVYLSGVYGVCQGWVPLVPAQ
jgi:hypothetical protein